MPFNNFVAFLGRFLIKASWKNVYLKFLRKRAASKLRVLSPIKCATYFCSLDDYFSLLWSPTMAGHQAWPRTFAQTSSFSLNFGALLCEIFKSGVVTTKLRFPCDLDKDYDNDFSSNSDSNWLSPSSSLQEFYELSLCDDICRRLEVKGFSECYESIRLASPFARPLPLPL